MPLTRIAVYLRPVRTAPCLGHSRRKAIAAQARTDAERAGADVLDQALASERVRADALRKQMEEVQGALAAERGDADALRNRMNELKELLAGVVRAQKTEQAEIVYPAISRVTLIGSLSTRHKAVRLRSRGRQ
jgi:hypothetical protein